MASTVIGAAWRGYSTRRDLRSGGGASHDEERMAKLEAAVQQANLLREAQEQASRFLWEEVKNLRLAQTQSDARFAQLQARCDKEVQRSQALAEQLHLLAKNPTTLQLTQIVHAPISAPAPPPSASMSPAMSMHPTALAALQQLANMDSTSSSSSSSSPLKNQQLQQQQQQLQSHQTPAGKGAGPAASAVGSPSVPAFDANAFLRGYSEGDDDGAETARGIAPKPAAARSSAAAAATAPPALHSSSPVTTHDANSSQVVSHLESSPLRFSKLLVDVLAGRGLSFSGAQSGGMDQGEESMLIQMHPYAVVTCQASRGETEAEENTSEPEWITNFVLDVDVELSAAEQHAYTASHQNCILRFAHPSFFSFCYVP